jgi:predicted nicotinamide N-methyase
MTAKASVVDSPIPGGWGGQMVRVASREFRLILPADPDAFLDHLADPLTTDEPHLADPYWSKLWPAALPLAEAILRGAFPPGTRVLELGCGSGLAGLAALAAELDVTFSDYVPRAVELALENAANNGFSQARGLVFDWRAPLAEQWPVIIAADVMYDRAHIDPLLSTLGAMLAPGGIVWLGDAGRGPVADFLQRAKGRGWTTQLLDERDQPRLEPVLGHYQLLVLQRAQQSSRPERN